MVPEMVQATESNVNDPNVKQYTVYSDSELLAWFWLAPTVYIWLFMDKVI